VSDPDGPHRAGNWATDCVRGCSLLLPSLLLLHLMGEDGRQRQTEGKGGEREGRREGGRKEGGRGGREGGKKVRECLPY